MYLAQMIVVLVSKFEHCKSVKWSEYAPSRGPIDALTLEGVYHSFATRVHPERDPQRERRKVVVQSNWIQWCLENRQLDVGRRTEWEVMFVDLQSWLMNVLIRQGG